MEMLDTATEVKKHKVGNAFLLGFVYQAWWRFGRHLAFGVAEGSDLGHIQLLQRLQLMLKEKVITTSNSLIPIWWFYMFLRHWTFQLEVSFVINFSLCLLDKRFLESPTCLESKTPCFEGSFGNLETCWFGKSQHLGFDTILGHAWRGV